MTHTNHLGEATILHDRISSALAAPEVWALLMRSAAVHTLYGPLNHLMITAQRPGSSNVRPRSEWEEIGHRVLDGEQGIKVFVPAPGDGMGPDTRRAFPPDCEPMTSQSQEEECLSCVGHYDVAQVWDISQTTAANDENVRYGLPPKPVAFIEEMAVTQLRMCGRDAEVSDAPTEETALARLQELTREWTIDNWLGDDEGVTLTLAHLVARMAGMRHCGPVPVPNLLPEAMGCNGPLKVAATKVIRAAREIYQFVLAQCPCCGEVA